VNEVNKITGSPYLRFDGNKAGIGRSASGDTNSPHDYMLVCGCGASLGVLSMFSPNTAEQRSCWCPKCRHAVAIGKEGQILSYFPHDPTKPVGGGIIL
jgi:hypothetical protein